MGRARRPGNVSIVVPESAQTVCPYLSSWLVAFPRCKPAQPHEPSQLVRSHLFLASPRDGEEENVRGWAEDRLRKMEKQQDTVATFNRRVHVICKQYPGGAQVVLARRMNLCIQRKRAPIGK